MSQKCRLLNLPISCQERRPRSSLTRLLCRSCCQERLVLKLSNVTNRTSLAGRMLVPVQKLHRSMRAAPSEKKINVVLNFQFSKTLVWEGSFLGHYWVLKLKIVTSVTQTAIFFTPSPSTSMYLLFLIQLWMNEWMCIYIPLISHSVPRRFTILLELDRTSAC